MENRFGGNKHKKDVKLYCTTKLASPLSRYDRSPYSLYILYSPWFLSWDLVKEIMLMAKWIGELVLSNSFFLVLPLSVSFSRFLCLCLCLFIYPLCLFVLLSLHLHVSFYRPFVSSLLFFIISLTVSFVFFSLSLYLSLSLFMCEFYFFSKKWLPDNYSNYQTLLE